MSDYTCTKCGSGIDVFYTDPPTYVCGNKECSQAYRDASRDGAQYRFGALVLTEEQARAKRPAMYGLPTCVIQGCCTHQPHGEKCLICEEIKRPAKLVPVVSHWRRKP